MARVGIRSFFIRAIPSSGGNFEEVASYVQIGPFLLLLEAEGKWAHSAVVVEDNKSCKLQQLPEFPGVGHQEENFHKKFNASSIGRFNWTILRM